VTGIEPLPMMPRRIVSQTTWPSRCQRIHQSAPAATRTVVADAASIGAQRWTPAPRDTRWNLALKSNRAPSNRTDQGRSARPASTSSLGMVLSVSAEGMSSGGGGNP
jgi:uncharacterized membrane protein YgcG